MSDIAGVMLSSADARSPAELVADVHRIEEMGYQTVWIVDAFGREIYVTAAHLLAATSSITVATGWQASTAAIQWQRPRPGAR